MIIPNFLFASLATRNLLGNVGFHDFLYRSCKILVWLFLHLLTFTISNQNHDSAILEDKLNKPWRPLPAGRIQPDKANTLRLCITAFSSAFSLLEGGTVQSLFLMVLFWLYNGSGDVHWLSRNILNAAGFAIFASGAASAALPPGNIASPQIMRSVVLIAAIVATTVHAQDMYGQEGDRAAGRKTIPLYFGDRVARRTLFTAIALWSCFICTWQIGIFQRLVTGVLGTVVSLRALRGSTPAEDRRTFWIYNFWLMSIYVGLCS